VVPHCRGYGQGRGKGLLQRRTESDKSYTGSFAQIGDGSRNYLGRNNWKEAAPDVEELQGQMDEVRVWNYARTREQIRDNLFTTLTGKETGLVGYWNFDDGNANDLAPGQHHGTLFGKPTFPTATREYHLLAGKVIGADGKLVESAEIRLLSGAETVATSKTDANGNCFCLLVDLVSGPCDIQAVKEQTSAWRFNVDLARITNTRVIFVS
jgi:hypothetical protein